MISQISRKRLLSIGKFVLGTKVGKLGLRSDEGLESGTSFTN